MKMHTCAQSIVMRRAFMLFEEFVPGFGYEWVDKHKIDKLGKGIRGPVIKKVCNFYQSLFDINHLDE